MAPYTCLFWVPDCGRWSRAIESGISWTVAHWLSDSQWLFWLLFSTWNLYTWWNVNHVHWTLEHLMLQHAPQISTHSNWWASLKLKNPIITPIHLEWWQCWHLCLFRMFDAANVPQTPWLAYSTETKTRATNKHTAVSFGSSMDSVTMCDPQHATGCASFSQQASVSFSPQATGCVSPQVDPNILHVGSLNFYWK